jgi:hypothetical protein
VGGGCYFVRAGAAARYNWAAGQPRAAVPTWAVVATSFVPGLRADTSGPPDSRRRLSPHWLSLHGRWLLLRCRDFFRDGFLEIVQRKLQAFLQLDLRFPAEELAGFGDVGLALPGIVLRQGFVGDFAF